MKYFSLLLFSILISISSANSQTSQPGLLDWLQGTWLEESKGIYEEWTKIGVEKLAGEGYSLEKGTKQIYEKIILEYTAEGGNYAVNLQDNGKTVQTTIFKSIEFTRDVATFENRENQFPVRIKYLRKGTDELQVLLYDISDKVKATYNFKRIQR